MLYEYNEKNFSKNKNGLIKRFVQIKPFTFGEKFNGIIAIEKRGTSLAFYSIKTKQCLGVSNEITIKLFKEV